MTNTSRSSALRGLAALTLVAAGLAASGPFDAQAADPAGTTLTLDARPTGGGGIDNRPKGPSLGDAFFQSVALTDTAGHRVGTADITGELVAGSPSHGREQTTVTIALRDGQLVATGGHPAVDGFTLPVVGGTGAYTAAAGTLRVTPGSHGTEHATIALVPR